MRFADNLKYLVCRGRLLQRRKVVTRTLEYLDTELGIVDANRQWKTSSMQRTRKQLIDEVRGWYDLELKKIDSVLDRLNQPSNPGRRFA